METKYKTEIEKVIKLKDAEIKRIEVLGCGLQMPKYKRTCKKFLCPNCYDIGVLYRERNLLRDIIKKVEGLN